MDFLYEKDSGKKHKCLHAIDYKELLASGYYFKTIEEAKAEEAQIVEEPKAVVTAKKKTTKAS